MQKAENCILRIQNMYAVFHRVEKKIADFVLQNPERIVGLSISEVAAEIQVAESSIVRFCKMLKLTGFSDLKLSLAGDKREKVSLPYGNVVKEDEPYTILDKVFRSSIQALNESRNYMDHGKFLEAVHLMQGAKRIAFYGMYTSSTIVHDAYIRLYRIGCPVSYFTDPYEAQISASMLDRDCVAFGISHTGRTKDTIEALSLAKGRGAKVIVLTSFERSPILNIADVPLIVCSAASEGVMEAVSSRISHIVVLDALCTCVGVAKYDETTAQIEKNSEIINRMRY